MILHLLIVDTVVNRQLRDQPIAALRSNDVRKEFMKFSKLTLADAVAKAVALETSIAESSMYEYGPLESPSPTSMNKVSLPSLGNQGKLPKCKYCGRLHMRGEEHYLEADASAHIAKIQATLLRCVYRKRKAPIAQVVETAISSKLAEPLHHVYI